MKGTTVVDFAGTREEAAKFVRWAANRFPRSLTLGRGSGEESPNGDPQLFAQWFGAKERRQVREIFANMGWGEGEFAENVWKSAQKGK